MKFRPLLLVPLMIGCLQAASVDDLTFTLNDDGVSYSVTDCDTAATGEMIIPSTYNSLPVTSIGNNAFLVCTFLSSITIPDSVTSIGEYAFYYCTSLSSITIPDSVTSIGEWAFYRCTSLSSITIGDSVTSIGEYAFYECTSLSSITIPDSVTSIGEWAFGSTGLSFLEDTNSIKYLISASGNKAYLIDGSSASGNVVLPSNFLGAPVTLVADRAFYECTSLSSITIPDSVTSIGEWAFYRCTSLSSITIPDTVTSIGGWAFYECTSLSSITIPDSVTSIGEWAFYECTSLSSITIPDSVTSIGEYAFYYCTSLSSITIPDSVTSIGEWAFYRCTSLSSITIGDSVTSIGEYAFRNCSSLSSITIGDSVTSIGEYAFYECTSLSSITIPDSVTSIGEWAFYRCTSLSSITIPDTVTSIGILAFSDCTSLTSITIPNRFAPQYSAIGLTGNLLNNLFYQAIAEVLQEDNDFIAKLAEAMIAAENNSGLATKEDLPIAVQQGINQVVAAPSVYNLATTAEVAQARSEGVTAGIQSVTSDPQSYQLYSESSILEMNVSNPTLSMLNETQQAQVEFTLETSTDLEDWAIEERIQRTVQATGDKFFVRISSGAPYVTPTVLVFNHPSYGEILTDQSGNVLYGFSIDSAGGDPLYSGSAWPLASHSTDPEPDADVTAALTSGTYSNTSGGPWLKINDRPVYTYAGDSELNQASGHGQGSVWFTIRPDGTLNQ